MKTIGLIGGLSWESTAVYYRLINEDVRNTLGGLHSAQCIVYSFNFERIVNLQKAGEWEEATKEMIHAAKSLEKAGADLILICTNTMHLMAPAVQESIRVPLLHIVDSTAKAIKSQGIEKVGLLGTMYTMEQPFYRERFSNQHNISIITPNEEEKKMVHNIIFNELCQGQVIEASKKFYVHMMRQLVKRGAQGIILGCTEIPLLVKQSDSDVPLFDTTALHATEAVRLALAHT